MKTLIILLLAVTMINCSKDKKIEKEHAGVYSSTFTYSFCKNGEYSTYMQYFETKEDIDFDKDLLVTTGNWRIENDTIYYYNRKSLDLISKEVTSISDVKGLYEDEYWNKWEDVSQRKKYKKKHCQCDDF